MRLPSRHEPEGHVRSRAGRPPVLQPERGRSFLGKTGEPWGASPAPPFSLGAQPVNIRDSHTPRRSHFEPDEPDNPGGAIAAIALACLAAYGLLALALCAGHWGTP